MKKKTPEEWLIAIQSLPENIQRGVAKIIWWDFFGGRIAARRWDHLDKWVKTPLEDIPDDLMLEGLISVGFTETQARMRIFPEERLTVKNVVAITQETQTQPTEIQ